MNWYSEVDDLKKESEISPTDTRISEFKKERCTLYNVCAVPWGCSVPWGVQYRGGYHEYRGGYHDKCGGIS